MPQTTRTLAVCALGALVLACDDSPTEPGPAELVIVQAPSTVGAPGWELIDTLVIRAVDLSGSPRAGIEVTWTVRQGGGSIAPTADETDSDGLARAVWTLGGASGVNQVRASTLEGSQADFESTGEAFRVDRVVSAWGIGCGLVDGAIWCWGNYFWGNGAPVSHNPEFGWSDYGPELVAGPSQFVDLSVSNTPSVCGLDQHASVWCATEGAPVLSPIGGLPPIRYVTSMRGKHCGLATSDSTLWCWGNGDGVGAQVPGISGLIGVWMDRWGVDSTGCGLRADSTAVCWGRGPLGDGSTVTSGSPVVVSGNHRFVELAVSLGFACGRTAAGEVWCWGEDGNQATPTQVLSPLLAVTGVHGIATDFPDIQVIQAAGQVLKWERAVFGPVVYPTGLDGLAVARAAANNNLACVQLADDQVYCFDELFENSSAIGWNSYSPVQPVRQVPVLGGPP